MAKIMGNAVIVPIIRHTNTDEALKTCAFRHVPGIAKEVSERNFPWVIPSAPSFEMLLIKFPDSFYLGELNQQDDVFTLPQGFEHGNHIHLLSYHAHLPKDEYLYGYVAAAGATGMFHAGEGVLYLKDDGKGGCQRIKDPLTSMGDEMVCTPYCRTIGVHSARGPFDHYQFLIVKPTH